MQDDPTYIGNAILSLKHATGWSTDQCADYVLTWLSVRVVDTIAHYNKLKSNGHGVIHGESDMDLVMQNSTLAKCPVLECKCLYHEEGTYHSNPECPFFID